MSCEANDGWGNDNPDYSNVVNVAETLRLFMQINNWQEAKAQFDLSMEDYYEIRAQVSRLNASIDTILIRQSGSYKIFNGKGIQNGELSFDGQHIDAINRVSSMNHPKRSGDIILIMKDATTGGEADRYTTAYACKSWHGSLNPSDSYVPFIISYPGGNKDVLETMKQKVCASSECGGNWVIKAFITEIIIEQYPGQ